MREIIGKWNNLKRSIGNMPFWLIVFLILNLIAPGHAAGPKNRTIPIKNFQKVFYVSIHTGQDIPTAGSRQKPWRTIQYAIKNIPENSDITKIAVLVSAGHYLINDLQLKKNIYLFGGFDESFAKRDIFGQATILNGQSKGCILIPAINNLIDGFVFINGSTRGKGGAIFCQGVSPTISNNIFRANQTLAPTSWNPIYRHEIANDGGAIYVENGAHPVLKNNLFIDNTTEVGRGAAIALHDHCAGVIKNNVFINNVSGVKDPKRSSDGGAVSIFKWSSPVVENNIFLNNKAKNSNDGGGLFVALWSSPELKNNIFVGNYGDDDGGALFIGGQEHRYDKPNDTMPPENAFFVRIVDNMFFGNSNASANSGVMRLTMETRGVFENNICAFNTGVYFQRSEMTIKRNIFFDNVLCIETRKWLKPYEIDNNYFFGKFLLTAPANQDNNWKYKETPDSNVPIFFNDRFEVACWSATFNSALHQTIIFAPDLNVKKDALKNRVVNANGRWGVVETNEANFIYVWGKLENVQQLIVLPSYRLLKK